MINKSGVMDARRASLALPAAWQNLREVPSG